MKTRMTKRAGFTLVELLVALAIIGVVSTAVAAMLTGAARTSQFVNSETDAISQAEIVMRRIVHNLRAASAINAPTDTTASSTLTVVTQQDAANSNATYTVTYTLSGTNLTESDPRYDSGGSPNVIARNVTNFRVTRQSTSTPQTVVVTMTIGASPPVTRTVTVYCRNL